MNRFEEAETIEATFAFFNQNVIISVPLAHLKLTADHIIARAGVAVNIDTFDVNTRAFLNDEGQRHSLGNRIAVTAGMNLRKCITLAGNSAGHGLHAFFDSRAIVNITNGQRHIFNQIVTGDVFKL